MSETSDERIVSKSTLKRREQIIKDPSIMYAKYEEFFETLEIYREAEGIRRGVRDNNPDALIVFDKYYQSTRAELNRIINSNWLRCLHIAQSLTNDLFLFGEDFSPENLIIIIISNKRKARKNLKKLKKNGDLPILASLDLI